MTIQNKALLMLSFLKAAGISYKEFSKKTGISLDQIYARTSRKVNLTEERANYYMCAAELHFPAQYKIIKQRIDDYEKKFPLL